MADVTKQAPEEAPMGGIMKPHPTPLYAGDVKSMTTVKAVNLHQLLTEIDERLGDRDKYQVVLDIADHRQPVSTENPLTIHVHPAEVDMTLVQGVVEGHVPEPNYGKSARDLEVEALKARLLEGDLALPELNSILRSIIGS